MPAVNLPDGRRVHFPDGMPEAEISAALEQISAPQQAAPEKGLLQSAAETLGDSTEGIARGTSLGFGDEAYGAFQTPIRMAVNAFTGADEGKGLGDRISDAYASGRDVARSRYNQSAERSPIASTVGELAGGLATGGALNAGPAVAGVAASPTVARILTQGAKEGAAYGGAYGVGTGEGVDERLTGGALGALTGGLTGRAVDAVGGKIAQSVANKAIPTNEGLRNAAKTAYDVADQAGIVVSQPTMRNLADDLITEAKNAGVDRTIHPKVTAALSRFDEAAQGTPSLNELELLRRVMGAAAKGEPDERRIAGILLDKLDDRVSSLSPAEVLSGNVQQGTEALTGARKLWGTLRRSETIDDLIENARLSSSQFSGSGFENALRRQFSSLAKNDKKMRGFSDEEREAIEKVANGTFTGNVLRQLGKFSPTGIVSSALSSGTGFTLGGPVGAIAVPAAGYLARQGATAMTRANANAAGNLVRSGGKLPQSKITPEMRAMIEALTIGGAQQGANDNGEAAAMARALSGL